MALAQLVVVSAIIYASAYFFDVIFKTCSHYPYVKFLNWAGLDVGFFRVTWFTTSLNRHFQRWGPSSTAAIFLHHWFDFGSIVTVCLIPISFYLLIHSAIQTLWTQPHEQKEAILVPMVPGVNLPLSDGGYYIMTLSVASVVHELGHIIAARLEGVPVRGVGLTLVFLLPAAFVRLSAQLGVISPRRQLRVLSAGVWHNIILSIVAYLLLLALPTLLHPFYSTGRGVSVMAISQKSPLAGPTGVEVGDKLTAVNDCEVADAEGWHHCVKMAAKHPPLGFCVHEDLIHQMDESVPVKHTAGGHVECCASTAQSHLCFEALSDDAPLQILQYSCLPGRAVVGSASYSCRRPRDCPPSLHCIRPVLSNGTSLLRIQRSEQPVVIFVGEANQAVTSLRVSSFIPAFSFVTALIPEVFAKLCKYLVVFSAGFAIVNAVPCFYSDGDSIFHSMLRYLGASRPRKQRLVQVIFNVCGLLLLLVNVLTALWRTFDTHYSQYFFSDKV